MLHQIRRAPVLALLSFCLEARAAEPPRSEYPRPDFVRSAWLSLNGPWEFQFDDRNVGLEEKWYAEKKPFAKSIRVPYPFQAKLSGIAETGFHDVAWYRRAATIPAEWKGKHVLLHFGAVDYRARVWVNGQFAGEHEGGQTPFSFDVTRLADPARNLTIVVRAEDPSTDTSIPRGKQFWEEKSRGIWYTRTSGIWQPVWLEPVPDPHLMRVVIRPNPDDSTVRFEGQISRATPGLRLRVRVEFGGEFQGAAEARFATDTASAVVHLPAQRLWSPERPDLYDAALEVYQGETVVDSVRSYFGQRKISTRGGRVELNNRPYFLKMVLDQGYWPESILTPPSDDAIQYDIRMTKALGFNGARKHQKVEDPRYLYWADRMGLVVSGEMANAQVFTEDYASRMTKEWNDVVLRDISHPSIISWYPINESWGVPQVRTNRRQQDHCRALYYLTRALDPSRLAVDNDGWEHTEATDLFTVHDYAPQGDALESRYASFPEGLEKLRPANRALTVDGARYIGTPLVISEFGGIAYRPAGAAGRSEEWGYSGIEPTEAAFLGRFEGLVRALRRVPQVAGYTDVEQEINGLLTYDRKPKVDPEKVRRLQQ
ncbi:MAG: glycoside hydrolase family 2 [Acidobacteria bacterium]|nr:MAG: glycoside hydrolase family 2 [Acidobacteriota bacterium]